MSDQVLAGMHNGLSLRKACIAAKTCAPTFILWVSEDAELAEQYVRAREALLEKMADDTLEIADEPVGTTDNGSTDSGAVAKQKLQVETRKWLLSKLAPKKYGDKVAVVGGDDGDSPVKHKVDVTLTADEAYKRMLNG